MVCPIGTASVCDAAKAGLETALAYFHNDMVFSAESIAAF
jgi:hypothetical protein